MEGKGLHRKLWEWCAIAEALEKRGMLQNGKHGLGFAVGREPLASLFAKLGCEITATDLPIGQAAEQWQATGQFASNLEEICWTGLLDYELFKKRVDYPPVDMNALEGLESQSCDFLWSSCSFEHLGSLESGIGFVLDSLKSLRPGGIAVHTTEYNVSSNNDTLRVGDSVIYRQRDIEKLDRLLRLQGAAIEHLDFEAGCDPHDIGYGFPPYYTHGREHVKLNLGGHISTSILLIIRTY